MSEIKMQVWDGEEMLTISSALALDLVGFSGEDLEIYSGDVYVRRFTGLKDRNGKEIYESDYLSDGKFKWLVIFLDGAFWARRENKVENIKVLQRKRHIALQNDCIEVIGNIYESPELLDANPKE